MITLACVLITVAFAQEINRPMVGNENTSTLEGKRDATFVHLQNTFTNTS
jgi:hypothetical protein